MFRKDILTVKRENYETIKGLVTEQNETLIAKDIPCHLSISLNNTSKENKVPYLKSDFTLFLSPKINFEIKQNDILYVLTPKNRTYKLFAGEIKIYDFSIQIKCRQNKIIET